MHAKFRILKEIFLKVKVEFFEKSQIAYNVWNFTSVSYWTQRRMQQANRKTLRELQKQIYRIFRRF